MPPAPQMLAQFLVLLAVSVFILALVQLARNRREAAEREAERFAALNWVGIAPDGVYGVVMTMRLTVIWTPTS
jgi:hypothetical protein